MVGASSGSEPQRGRSGPDFGAVTRTDDRATLMLDGTDMAGPTSVSGGRTDGRRAMQRWDRTLVRRWGGRAVGLAMTGIGLYVVAPSLLSIFGSWPRLRDVQPWWFLVLVALEACSLASLWWLTRLALAPADQAVGVPLPRWGAVASAQLAGNAASKVVPGARPPAVSSRRVC